MNPMVKNILKVSCVMLGAGLSMVGNLMGDSKKDDTKDVKADEK